MGLVAKVMTWVLFTFKESLFATVHSLYLISSVLVEIMRFSKDLYLKRRVVSSPKRIVDTFSDNLKISLIYIKNNKAESTQPRWSPMLMVKADEIFEFIRTW